MNVFDVLNFYQSPIPLSVDGIQIPITSNLNSTVDFIAAVTGVASTGSVIILVGFPSAADTVTIGDGTNSVIFEFNTTLTVGDVLVNTTGFIDEEDYAAGLKTAVDASNIGSGGGGDLTTAISTTTATNDTLDLTNTIANGTTGNVTITKSGTALTLSGMSGGVDTQENQIKTTDATLFTALSIGQSFTVPAGTSTDPANIGTFVITDINNTISPYTITIADTLVDDTGVLLTYAGAVSTTNPVGYVNGSYPDSLGTNLSETIVVEISPTTDVHFRVGINPVATSSDIMICKGNNKQIICKNNEKVSFIKVDGALDGFIIVAALRKG